MTRTSLAGRDSSGGLVGANYAELPLLGAAPATPAAGKARAYLDNNGALQLLPAAGILGRRIAVHWGSGTAFPALAAAGDTFVRTDVGTAGSLWQYTGIATVGTAGWVAESPVVCTSTTRPTAALYAGLTTYETDTHLSSVYDGSVWAPVGAGQWIVPLGALGDASYNWTIPATMSTAPGMSGTATVPAGRQLEVEFRAPKLTLGASGEIRAQLLINGAAYDYQQYSTGPNMSIYWPLQLHAVVGGLNGPIVLAAQFLSAGSQTLQGLGSNGPLLRYRIC